MAATEINATGYELLSLRHEMGRASVMRFFVPNEFADSSSAFAVRSEVRYTVNSVCVFYGRIVTPKREVRDGVDGIEYTAADPLEFLAHNPVANAGEGVNAFYNRKDVDVSAYAYPDAYSVASILGAELASILGGTNDVYSLDFSLASSPSAVVPLNVQVKGKSWLGLIDALVAEVPGMSYWYDPTACTFNVGGTLTHGGTLKFYDLSQAGTGSKKVVLPMRSTTASLWPINCEGLEINEDVSASYDTVVVHGWGDMVERYDSVTADWTALASGAIGGDMPFLRYAASGEIEAFEPSTGTWVPESTRSPRPYFPESNATGYRSVGRRFSVPKTIFDIRVVQASSGPAVYRRDVQSMWLEAIQNEWDIGPSWTGAGGGFSFHQVSLVNGIRIADIGPPATVDNDGDVRPNPRLYPTFPVVGANDPRFQIPVPTAYERDRFVTKEPLVRRTDYLFSSNASGNALYNGLVGQPCFKYWYIYAGTSLRYTGGDPFYVTRTDGALGYNKRLDLYDERFLKYTNKDAVVIRDDTTLLDAYADHVWSIVKRKRVYGSAKVHEPGANPLTLWPMGCSVQVFNYGADDGTYDIPVRVQAVDLSRFVSAQSIEVSFDRANTFTPLNKYLESKEFFLGALERGDGKLEGKRGDKVVVDKAKPKKPVETGGMTAPAMQQNISVTDPTDPAALVRGKILSVSVLKGTGTTTLADPNCVKYLVQTIDGARSSTVYRTPICRQFHTHDEIMAAAVGSECIIAITPLAGTSGSYDLMLFSCNERLAQRFIDGTISSASALSGLPAAISYDWESFDGVYTGTADYPLYRPYNLNPRVVAALPGSPCKIFLDEGGGGFTARLWSCIEQLDFEACGPGTDSYTFAYGGTATFGIEAMSSTAGPAGTDAEEIVSESGDVILDATATYTESAPEDDIITGTDYIVTYDINGDAVVAYHSTSLLDPDYLSDILFCDAAYETVFLSTALNQVDVAAIGSGGSSETG